jgi:hypothetical protein
MHGVIPTRILLHIRESGAPPSIPVDLNDFEMHLSLEAPRPKSSVRVDMEISNFNRGRATVDRDG